MGAIRSFYFSAVQRVFTMVQFSHEATTMHDQREHVISVVLNHHDWQAFVRLQPQPVTWLMERIQETIAQSQAERPHSQSSSRA
jgi:hypothetical protein